MRRIRNDGPRSGVAGVTAVITAALVFGPVVGSASAAQAAVPSAGAGSAGTTTAKSNGSAMHMPPRSSIVASSPVQQASGDLSTVKSITVHGGYTAAGIGMRDLGYGTITISGVPAKGTVRSAILMWDVLADQQSAPMAQGSFAGHAVTGTAWASGASPCWATNSNFSYEADVTKFVSGNASYQLAGFASGRTDGADPWGNSADAPLLEGATLVVVYQLASMPETVVQIAEGAGETESGNSATATLTGFTATKPVSARTTFIVADGQETGNTASADGVPLAGVGFPGADPQAAANYSQGNLWDTVTTDVGSAMSPKDQQVTLSVTGGSDCLVWVGQVLSVHSVQALVAMGDSYSSGEGNPPFEKGTATLFDSCHRSTKAWPELIASQDPAFSKEAFIACSGATTKDITTDTFKTEAPQVDQLKALPVPPDMPQVITLTVGGNDTGFASIATYCFLLPDCTFRINTAEKYVHRTLPGVLAKAYNAIKKADPTASVVVAGYPRLFPSSQSQVQKCGWLNNTKRTKLNALAVDLDRAIETAAGKAGFTYVSTLNAFNGHELCVKSGSWVNPIGELPLAYDAHPNALGQRALESAVRAQIG